MKGYLKVLALVGFALLGTKALAQIGFPYCESFQTPSTRANTIFGGDAKLIGGVLRLTDNQPNQRGFIYIDVPFPSSYGLKVEFEYFSYGGTGQFLADGLSMFLFDGDTQNFNSGGFGGSLGYAQRNGEPGLSNGYLGIGFDEFGNFGNSTEGKNGGLGGISPDELVPNSIVLRGPGNGSSGYPFVIGKKTMSSGTDGVIPGGQFEISSGGAGTFRVTDPNAVGYRRVNLELVPNSNGVGFFVTLSMVVTTQPRLPRQITIFEHPYNFPAPKNLKIGFAASTGFYSNFHEIRNLTVEVSAEDQLQDPAGVDITGVAACAGQENQYYIRDEEVVLPNENSLIRCLQFYESMEEIDNDSEDLCSQGRCLEQNRYLILPQGTFAANDQAGGFTFFPNEEYVGGEVTVFYTIADNYGMSSNGNSITLKIEESPAPIRLLVSDVDETTEHVDICPGESVVLVGMGEESYERFEWYKDRELIEGAEGSTFTARVVGEYEVIGYNRRNCPAISNKVHIAMPAFPDSGIDPLVVGCAPDQPVDVTEHIPGYDATIYDYQLSGRGLLLMNDALESVEVSGEYELRVKLKSLECYSEPVPVEIFIQETELMSDFDFGVKGSGVKDELGGGVFPDDEILFEDLSDERAIGWEWDFGDGMTSQEQNPMHVFGKKGEFDVELIISDQYGCKESVVKTVSINRSYRLMVPTGFTPTAAENKTFLPKHKGLIRFELLIFNTWGELIFRSEDLETEGWDGTLEGTLVDSGIYAYRINGVATDGENVIDSGKFILIR